LHCSIPITVSSTVSIHLPLGLPTGLLLSIYPFKAFLVTPRPSPSSCDLPT
jgi:hypothetical protein